MKIARFRERMMGMHDCRDVVRGEGTRSVYAVPFLIFSLFLFFPGSSMASPSGPSDLMIHL